jgi:transposase-like protein
MSRPGKELTRELIDRMCYWRGIGYSVAAMCKEVGISSSTYYRWVREAEAFALFDRMHAAGLSYDEIEAVVMAVEREREGAA